MEVTITRGVLVGTRHYEAGARADLDPETVERLASDGAIDGDAIEGFEPCHRPYGPAAGPTMRVEARHCRTIYANGRFFGPGEVVEAPEEIAREWVSHGDASPTRRVVLVPKEGA